MMKGSLTAFAFTLLVTAPAGAHFVGVAEAELSRGEGETGTSVALDAAGDRALVGEPGAERAWVYARSGRSWAIEQGLPSAARGFGHDVALDASGTRALIGSLGQVAEVWIRAGTTWTREATLSPTTTGSTQFGRAVALSAAGDVALVGAASGDLAEVFVRSESAWTSAGELRGATTLSGNRFGADVALDAAGSRAFVAAPFWLGAAVGRGGVLVFARAGDAWVEEGAIEATGAGDYVAVDGAGVRAVTGGRVYLRAGASWTEEATLPSVTGGYASAAMDADGTHVILGAPEDTRFGHAWPYARVGGAWVPDGELARGSAQNEDLGYAVAIDAAATRVLVGDPFPNFGGGTAHVWSRVGDPCADGSECISGHCVEGVCCDDACAFDCATCLGALNRAGFDGSCGQYSVAEARRVVCRPSAGPCDAEERCGSLLATCPADAVEAAGEPCRAARGPCDVEETCDGVGGLCPPDAVRPVGAVCRAGAGCDLEETCDGVGDACPEDALAPNGQLCRPSTHPLCDPAETCTGDAPECPEDVACLFDAGPWDAGSDAGGLVDAGVDADAGSGSDDASIGSDAGPRDGGPGEDAGRLVDAGRAFADGGPFDGGIALDGGIAPDGGLARDGATGLDAGMDVPPEGCACGAARSRGGRGPAAFAIVLAVALGQRRARRRRSR